MCSFDNCAGPECCVQLVNDLNSFNVNFLRVQFIYLPGFRMLSFIFNVGDFFKIPSTFTKEYYLTALETNVTQLKTDAACVYRTVVLLRSRNDRHSTFHFLSSIQ